AYLQSVAVLNTHYGRALPIDELTAEIIDAHAAWMAERYSPKTCEVYVGKLRSLLRASQAAAQAEPDPGRQQQDASGASGTVLREFLEETYLPEKAATAARKSREKLCWAVNLFCSFS